MTAQTQIFILRFAALALAAALMLTDRAVPGELWAIVGALAAATLPRPGDYSPRAVADEIEQVAATTIGE
jgi:hypothetical protein